jgi:hypothetical protein
VTEPAAPPRPHTELRRVTIYRHDDRLDVMTRRGIGFGWRCTCGEKAPRVMSRDAAIAGKREHEAGHRTP